MITIKNKYQPDLNWDEVLKILEQDKDYVYLEYEHRYLTKWQRTKKTLLAKQAFVNLKFQNSSPYDSAKYIKMWLYVAALVDNLFKLTTGEICEFKVTDYYLLMYSGNINIWLYDPQNKRVWITFHIRKFSDVNYVSTIDYNNMQIPVEVNTYEHGKTAVLTPQTLKSGLEKLIKKVVN